MPPLQEERGQADRAGARLPGVSRRLLKQLLDQSTKLGRRVSRNDFSVSDPGSTQRFLLDRVARGGGMGSLEMSSALILDRMEWPTLVIDDQKVDPLRVDAGVSRLVLAFEDFA